MHNTRRNLWGLAALAASVLWSVAAPGAAVDAESAALPSWRDTATRARLITFVAAVTTPGGPNYLAPADRIAVFDNDGTLWAEQPAYFQLLFALDLARGQIAEDPSLAKTSPYREIAAGELQALGKEGLLGLVMGTHAGISESEFAASVSSWMAEARHPESGRPFTDMVYQPMLELLAYLRKHEFQTWIVSGGGVSFMRVFSEAVYGIPPQQVIGSRVQLRYDRTQGQPRLLRQSQLAHLNDEDGKPVGIQQAIGRHPVIAVGNSDGDFAMLEWATSAPGPRLGMLIRHTDAEREWAYDRDSQVGRLARGLEEAEARDWLLVDMRADWSTVFSGP